ncbi:type II secretion system protein GspK [Thalassotalea hakodatensis]|uniref:type II secretion system protein GspK n=1 Tax=Thalassotalea hakodatensis TaxID=3030492 RepID=UPI0025737300|nr:type II secretion system protein GspK [Thalassotalea hakodatensis]
MSIKINSTSYTRQSGIALVQVLLISMIISLLALSFTYTAREQIATATALENRIQASNLIKSTQSKMLYLLLTQQNDEHLEQLYPNSEPWNVYGQPFVLINDESIVIKVRIQDNAGLLPLQFIKWPFWRVALENLGLQDQQIKEFQGRFGDWQDKDTDAWIVGEQEPTMLENGFEYRNFPIQLSQEIDLFFESHQVALESIKSMSTLYPLAGLKIQNAPNHLLKLLFPLDVAEQIIAERQNRVLTKEEINGILNNQYDETYLSFFPANHLTLSIQASVNDVVLQETIEFKFEPFANEPLMIFARY